MVYFFILGCVMFLTLIFCAIMLAVFLLVFLSFLTIRIPFIHSIGERIMFSAPTLLTSLGILGTFVGISFALLDFNANELDNSIPSLLDGMKIAFLTSAVGMALSILIKILLLLLGKENESGESQQLLENLDNQTRLLMALVDNIEKEKRIQQAFSKKLFRKFDHFANGLADSTSEHIVDALEQVIDKFNDKMSHQFGENFARLDDSVKDMLKWQENYRIYLETLANSYQVEAKTMREVKDSILQIENSISNIPILVKDFEKLIQFNQKQIGRIGDEMIIFTEVKDKLINSIPQIEHRFNGMAKTVEQTSLVFNQEVSKQTKIICQNLADISSNMAIAFTKEFNHGCELVKKDNEKVVSALLANMDKLQQLMNEFDKPIKENLNKMQADFNSTIEFATNQQMIKVSDSINAVEKSIHSIKDVVDKAVEKQLESKKGFWTKLMNNKKDLK